MTADDEFTARLISFGLSEKEARTYLHLLKYGPKTPSPLAKSLKTYREDVHRTLTALMEKGKVHPSLDTPTIYAAVDLDVALESAVKSRRVNCARWRHGNASSRSLRSSSDFGPPMRSPRSRF
ncbi:MAG TPA: helix-turn-helix domain-containing protein [Candidatus Acidoferrales bacterium]|nr:helix-turn-helix domain-containing protein [Candidatus Acidoferrales bacterium]